MRPAAEINLPFFMSDNTKEPEGADYGSQAAQRDENAGDITETRDLVLADEMPRKCHRTSAQDHGKSFLH